MRIRSVVFYSLRAPVLAYIQIAGGSFAAKVQTTEIDSESLSRNILLAHK